MAEKLTPQQSQAVHDRGGKLLVSAAAGSGKTKVLVDRLLGYLTDENDPANLDEFLIITYTKAAASELRGKIAAKLTERIAQEPENKHLQRQLQRLYFTNISTVHGFCGDLLRQWAYRLDLSADFRVADENECREIRDQVMERVLDSAYDTAGENPDFRAFVDTQGLGRSDKLVPEILLKVYDSARCHLDPEGWLQQAVENASVEAAGDAAETLWGRYLVDDLLSYLDHQIEAMSVCADLAACAEAMEKPAQLFSATVQQLQFLRSSETWDDVVARKNIDYGRLIFTKKVTDLELAEQLKVVRTACKKGLDKKLRSFADPSSQVLLDLGQSAAAVRGMVALVRAFSQEYDRVKKSRRILDFGDLEHKTLDLLLGKHRASPTAAALEIGERFREILVDEYQDSNAVQDAIFTALTGKRQNLFMVGDVKQSIYQFRLADPGIFLEKYNSYAAADRAQPGQGRKVLLSANFRSGGAVLQAVNEVFTTCMSTAVGGLDYGPEEALNEGISHIPLGGPEVELHCIQVQEDTYREEAEFTAQRIRQLLDGSHMVRQGEELRPITPEDIVILLRSPGSVGRDFQQALEAKGIRCTSGGGNDLLQTQEIEVLRSVLQVIDNPRQDIPLVAALASPVFGFTADDLAAIRSRKKSGTIYEALLRSDAPKAQAFLEILKQLRSDARLDTLVGLLQRVFSATRIDSIYGAMADGPLRRENLQAFYQLAVDYENGGHRDLTQFLYHLEAMEERGLISGGEATAGAVSIMSIHKSKGLEFPVVLLCGLSREFNRESLRAQVLCDRELGLGLSCVDSRTRVRYPTISKRAIAVKSVSDSLSEELRVLYVAMTRARDRLIMTYASRSLPGDLSDLALRMDLSHRELLTGQVVCPGEWVLLEALRHTEAGALHAIGGRPKETHLGDPVWKICVHEGAVGDLQPEETQKPQSRIPGETLEAIRQGLSFRYPHPEATKTPSKQAATQRKGREKDEEAAENAGRPRNLHYQWRKPSFADKAVQGKTRGSAIHGVLQYLRFEECLDEAAVRREIERLVEQRFITREQAALVDPAPIAAFFDTDLGRRIRQGKEVLREFKLSILDDANNYAEGLEGETVLLQGVLDCALVEDDGIILVDFKTDRVTEETLSTLTAQYRAQVEAYAGALERIYEKRVKEMYLYFFGLGRFAAL